MGFKKLKEDLLKHLDVMDCGDIQLNGFPKLYFF
jgi:hypothetical protein